MISKSPLKAALVTFGLTVAVVLAFWALELLVLFLFFRNSDEASWGVVLYGFFFAVVALPIGVLLSIGTFMKVKIQNPKAEPNQPLQRNASTGSVSIFQSPARRG
ncbi:hypothetical protein CMV30_02960 [Nibricoccus aquaticus]|uniref:Uncharacterized protein n=1 Tax=Nibricoccus aquaticus TaxID=2576891 RepID=A0A290Q9U4_9BACT|nr:hypothetical protein [Nibricoccus aquaticus]ATC63006.1 hypothetical protein CMV30_02960 [Nibricoccus aquaticus]